MIHKGHCFSCSGFLSSCSLRTSCPTRGCFTLADSSVSSGAALGTGQRPSRGDAGGTRVCANAPGRGLQELWHTELSTDWGSQASLSAFWVFFHHCVET